MNIIDFTFVVLLILRVIIGANVIKTIIRKNQKTLQMLGLNFIMNGLSYVFIFCFIGIIRLSIKDQFPEKPMNKITFYDLEKILKFYLRERLNRKQIECKLMELMKSLRNLCRY